MATAVAIGAYALRARNSAVEDYDERKAERELQTAIHRDMRMNAKILERQWTENGITKRINEDLRKDLEKFEEEKSSDIGDSPIVKEAGYVIHSTKPVSLHITDTLLDPDVPPKKGIKADHYDDDKRRCMTCKATSCDCQLELFE